MLSIEIIKFLEQKKKNLQKFREIIVELESH